MSPNTEGGFVEDQQQRELSHVEYKVPYSPLFHYNTFVYHFFEVNITLYSENLYIF